MKTTDFLYYFITFCALLGCGLYMVSDGNYIFGTLVLLTAFYHVFRSYGEIKRSNN